jgi:hypothetical protein
MKKPLFSYKFWLYLLLIVHVIHQGFTYSSEQKAINELHFIGICIWLLIIVYIDKKPHQFNFNQTITVPEESTVTSTNNDQDIQENLD